MIFFDCCHLGPTKSSSYCADQAAPTFSVIISLKKRVLEKLKPCQCNTMSSEMLLLIHLHFKLELSQYIDGDNSWSSLFMLEAEEIPRAVTPNAGFLSVL